VFLICSDIGFRGSDSFQRGGHGAKGAFAQPCGLPSPGRRNHIADSILSPQ
jgi:hypothetical protein